jgi:alpha-N-arabinofuranosidase
MWGRLFRFSLVLVGVPAVWAASEVLIDAARTREPISPYVYGQFIEHLGRCIYGGLWAEMLEDRKFYYPVTGEAPAWTMFTPGKRSWEGEGHPYELLTSSPWMILGEKKAVRMVRENAYVGEHTPRIDTAPDKPAGIAHERLGLVEGKDYVGRVVLAGDPAAAPIEVSLVWGGGAGDRHTVRISEIGRDYRKVPLRFRSGGSTDNGRLEIVGRGKGHFLVGAVSLMPADNVRGWRADTLALLRELNAPVYRWPGGNFVSGYDWKDGIGDPDRRPPRKNPAWKGIEHNDVGIHEFIELCRLIDAEPFVAVNTGLGTVELAAEQIEYANGDPTTRMGRLRAQNGHPAPFGVKFWAIGNEMYGSWQLGHMPLAEYVKKHNRVVEAMRAVDPRMIAIGVGAVGDWSRQMLTSCADHMSLISEHLYWQQKDDLVEHVRQIPAQIRKVAEAHRAYRRELASLAGKDIRIAMDEWNYWYGPNEFGELGVRYFLQDALGIAAGLNEFFRHSDLYYMANYAQTVNVIGAIKTTRTAAEFETTGLVLKLYRRHYGTLPVEVTGAPEPLDITAAWSEDKSLITVGIVNPTAQRQELALKLNGAAWTGAAGRHWLITGPHRWAHNHPGKPRAVDIHERAVWPPVVEVPPLSVNLVAFAAATNGSK